MAEKILPTPEQLRELLVYDPDTGKLFWKPRPVGMFSAEMYWKAWNTKNAGQEAFTAKRRDGYLVGSLQGMTLRAHRVAWAIYHGEWPAQEIDHKNLDPSDNRISNIREATSAQNKWNQRLKSSNTSGLKGVCWSSKEKGWLAQITEEGRTKRIGIYASAKQAHDAYCAEASRTRGDFMRVD